jgi:hypothetical protein
MNARPCMVYLGFIVLFFLVVGSSGNEVDKVYKANLFLLLFLFSLGEVNSEWHNSLGHFTSSSQ